MTTATGPTCQALLGGSTYRCHAPATWRDDEGLTFCSVCRHDGCEPISSDDGPADGRRSAPRYAWPIATERPAAPETRRVELDDDAPLAQAQALRRVRRDLARAGSLCKVLRLLADLVEHDQVTGFAVSWAGEGEDVQLEVQVDAEKVLAAAPPKGEG